MIGINTDNKRNFVKILFRKATAPSVGYVVDGKFFIHFNDGDKVDLGTEPNAKKYTYDMKAELVSDVARIVRHYAATDKMTVNLILDISASDLDDFAEVEEMCAAVKDWYDNFLLDQNNQGIV